MSKYNYDYDDTPPPPSKPPVRLDLWDMLSILVLLMTLCVGAYFVAVFASPNASYNLLNPARNQPPTPTITQIQPPATWTPTPLGPTETPTLTLLPTFTLEPSPTLVSLITPSITPTPTNTPKAPFSATVTYIDSTIIHPETACNWQGVGGTVVDSKNADLYYVVILTTGFYNGKTFYETSASGEAPAYGRTGFDVYLGPVPIESNGLLFIQAFDQGGQPLSNKIPINTYADCTKNLVLVRFKENP